MTLFVIRYSLYAKAQALTPNPLISDFRPPTSDLCVLPAPGCQLYFPMPYALCPGLHALDKERYMFEAFHINKSLVCQLQLWYHRQGHK